MRRNRFSRFAVVMLIVCLMLTLAAGPAFAKGKKKSSPKKKAVPTYTVVSQNGVSRTYVRYSQTRYHCTGRGCVMTAAAIAASAFGSRHTPSKIHNAPAKAPYSERAAVKALGKKYEKKRVWTPNLAAQFFRNQNIPCRYVSSFTRDQAISDITESLKAGKPVLVVYHPGRYKNVALAGYYHGSLLVGFNKDGTVKFIDPMSGTFNHSVHGRKKNNIRLTVAQLVKHFMFSSTKAPSVYMEGKANGGGYVVLG